MTERFLDIMNNIALPVVEKNECELVDSEFVKEGGQRILRFYIEKKEGRVSLDDCVNVSREISDAIDNNDNDRENFTLEVSSPGVNRVLKTEADFVRFAGQKVDLSLFSAVNGKKKLTAKLVKKENAVFTFEDEDGEFNVDEKNVGKINLHFDFDF